MNGNNKTIKSVGFVAIGRMGLPMAGHVQAGGFAVHAYDPGEAAGVEAKKMSCVMAATPADLARITDMAIVTVPTDDDVRNVVEGDGGLLEGASAGYLIAVSSSVHPDTMAALAKTCAAVGVGVIDAPITGGIRGAIAGTLTVLAAGAVADVERSRPVFACCASQVHRLGEAGAGQVGKMVNNMMLWANYMAAGQALTFAEKAGLDAESVRAIMQNCTGNSWALEQFPDVHPVWPVKDMATVAAMLKEMGLSLPLVEHVADNAKSISIEN